MAVKRNFAILPPLIRIRYPVDPKSAFVAEEEEAATILFSQPLGCGEASPSVCKPLSPIASQLLLGENSHRSLDKISSVVPQALRQVIATTDTTTSNLVLSCATALCSGLAQVTIHASSEPVVDG